MFVVMVGYIACFFEVYKIISDDSYYLSDEWLPFPLNIKGELAGYIFSDILLAHCTILLIFVKRIKACLI